MKLLKPGDFVMVVGEWFDGMTGTVLRENPHWSNVWIIEMDVPPVSYTTNERGFRTDNLLLIRPVEYRESNVP